MRAKQLAGRAWREAGRHFFPAGSESVGHVQVPKKPLSARGTWLPSNSVLRWHQVFVFAQMSQKVRVLERWYSSPTRKRTQDFCPARCTRLHSTPADQIAVTYFFPVSLFRLVSTESILMFTRISPTFVASQRPCTIDKKPFSAFLARR